MYVHTHYPKFLYHATEPARLVHSEDEHDKVGEGWHESPVDLTKPEVAAAPAAAAGGPSSNLEDLTIAQLKALADEAGKTYDPKAKKADLVALLREGK